MSLNEDQLVNEIAGQMPANTASWNEWTLRSAIRRGLNKVLRGGYDEDREPAYPQQGAET